MSYRDSEHPAPSWQDDEYRDMLAGEYVLGTLEDRELAQFCLLYTSPSPRDRQKSRMPSSA